MKRRLLSLLMPLALASPSFTGRAADGPPPSPPEFNAERGVWEFALPSEYQSQPARVQVLLPDWLEATERYPVLYILPVDASAKEPWGNGLAEARKANLANELKVICVYPLIQSGIPWYGNHASNAGNRQEDFMVKTLVPAIDARYPTRAEKEQRWLIGFSKSGWGAFTLLLNHPECFSYAAGWDTPFMLTGDNSGKDWGPMGLSGNFGTVEAMRPNVPTRLALAKAAWLKERTRLVLGPGNSWTAQSREMHDLLEKNGIPHIYRQDLLLKHAWDSGWFASVAKDLVTLARTP